MAGIHMTIGKNTGAQTGANIEIDKRVELPRHAVKAFANGGHRGVVFESHWQAAESPELRRYIDPFPAVERRGSRRRDPFHAKGPRHHDPHPQHPRPVQRRQRTDLIQHLSEAGKGRTRLGLLHQNESAKMDLAGQIHQHHNQRLMIKMDAN